MKDYFIFYNNSFIKQSDATLPVLSASTQFGLNVFEGIRVYKEDYFYIFRLEDHLERLNNSLNQIGFNAKVISTEEFIDNIVDMGYKQIHASNTLPTQKGGLSGKILMPHTLGIIRYIKRKHPNIEVIAGGGVFSIKDAKIYKGAGADHISLGSVCFTPWKIKNIIADGTKK